MDVCENVSSCHERQKICAPFAKARGCVGAKKRYSSILASPSAEGKSGLRSQTMGEIVGTSHHVPLLAHFLEEKNDVELRRQDGVSTPVSHAEHEVRHPIARTGDDPLRRHPRGRSGELRR